MAQDIRAGILAAARALGVDPIDLGTAISYETAGTFDPTKRGPTTQHGQHRGLIQFGEPQAKRYGVNWEDPIGSQLGEGGAVVGYLRDAGVKPGMGLLDIYSAINAGSVGRYGASDANNGGAPGTVRDKVNDQMAGHREKAMALLGGPASTVADGPKGQEVYPRAVMGSMVAGNTAPASGSSPPPAAVAAIAKGSESPLANIFGMMAMAPQQQTQFAPVQIMGPSSQQANALSSLIAALKNRTV